MSLVFSSSPPAAINQTTTTTHHKETTYFDEEAETAKEAVEKAVGAFQTIIADIEDIDQKNSVLRSNGLKVEQLKGELQMALNGGDHH
jgi:hypothetical protein